MNSTPLCPCIHTSLSQTRSSGNSRYLFLVKHSACFELSSHLAYDPPPNLSVVPLEPNPALRLPDGLLLQIRTQDDDQPLLLQLLLGTPTVHNQMPVPSTEDVLTHSVDIVGPGVGDFHGMQLSVSDSVGAHIVTPICRSYQTVRLRCGWLSSEYGTFSDVSLCIAATTDPHQSDAFVAINIRVRYAAEPRMLPKPCCQPGTIHNDLSILLTHIQTETQIHKDRNPDIFRPQTAFSVEMTMLPYAQFIEILLPLLLSLPSPAIST